MYCDAPSPQVIDPQHAADHIAPQIIEDKDFPYRITVRVQDGCGLMYEAIRSGGLMVRRGAIGRRMVEVEDLLNGSCVEGVSTKLVEELMQAGLPTCRSRNECWWEAMMVRLINSVQRAFP